MDWLTSPELGFKRDAVRSMMELDIIKGAPLPGWVKATAPGKKKKSEGKNGHTGAKGARNYHRKSQIKAALNL